MLFSLNCSGVWKAMLLCNCGNEDSSQLDCSLSCRAFGAESPWVEKHMKANGP